MGLHPDRALVDHGTFVGWVATFLFAGFFIVKTPDPSTLPDIIRHPEPPGIKI